MAHVAVTCGPNNARDRTEFDMPASAPRPLRRLRRALVLVGILTALVITAACRLEALGRVVAALAALACLAVWSMLLEAEGRACDRLETRAHRRISARRAGHAVRPRPSSRRRRAA
jgi:hypothetical protein